MDRRSWLTVCLLGVIVGLGALLLASRLLAPAHAQASEGQTPNVIAIATPYGDESLLYLVDTQRQVVLVYGFHEPGRTGILDPRSGAFELLAGRLYRWDALMVSKHGEFALRGIGSLRGPRVYGPGGSEEAYKTGEAVKEPRR
ncbi:MAG: hypothetical protein ACLF0G_05610 [Candidatus Brocadiia bacterium]